MLHRGKDVKLPQATKQKHEEQGSDADPMIVSLTSDKKIYLEKDPLRRRRAGAGAAGQAPAEPWKPILLKGGRPPAPSATCARC